MKKFMFATICGLGLLSSTLPANAMETPEDGMDVLEGVVMWLPNFAVNLVDIFSVEVGAGASVSLGAQATRACRVGFTTDAKTAKLIWGPNRQYGGTLDDGWEASFLCFNYEQYSRSRVTRKALRYERDFRGIPVPTDALYNWWEGPRNYWACSVWGSLGIQGQVDVNLDQVADCITSFFFIDIKGDWIRYQDMTGRSFK